MNLPKLDLSALPDLDTLTGVFGSLTHLHRAGGYSNDTVIILMSFLYEIMQK
jgi:hypothetical protein